jgi:hypothetical protein
VFDDELDGAEEITKRQSNLYEQVLDDNNTQMHAPRTTFASPVGSLHCPGIWHLRAW